MTRVTGERDDADDAIARHFVLKGYLLFSYNPLATFDEDEAGEVGEFVEAQILVGLVVG